MAGRKPKLSDAQIAQITMELREWRAACERLRPRAIAKRHGVHETIVRRIERHGTHYRIQQKIETYNRVPGAPRGGNRPRSAPFIGAL